MDEQKNGRRGFLRALIGGGAIAYAGMLLYPVIKYLIPPKLPEASLSAVLAGKTSEIGPNQGKIFKFGSKPGLLIRTPEGELRAFIAVCTHLACTVQYRSDMKLIWCACHNGRYDLNGINIAGPPPRPLTPLKVDLIKDDIYVSPRA